MKSNIYLKGDLLALVECVLSECGLKYAKSSILRHIQQHLVSGTDLLACAKAVLSKWGVNGNFLPLDATMLPYIPCPSLIALSDNALGNQVGHVCVLIEIGDKQCKLLDPSAGNSPFLIATADLIARWAGIVLGLDITTGRHEKNYLKSIRQDEDAVANAGGVSILMPVYNQAGFVSGAIRSALCQTYSRWELIIIDDGSTDGLPEIVKPFLADRRIVYYRNYQNEGLGSALNRGLSVAQFDMIAYLPADDIYYKNHLESLVHALVTNGAGMAVSGLRHHFSHQLGQDYGEMSFGKIENYPWQLVQVLHRKGGERWMERSELVTDDLDRMFWSKAASSGAIIGSYKVTCEWVEHARQRHKIINDRFGGGIYGYKKHYGVTVPIRFQSSDGNLINEIDHYQRFRNHEITATNSAPLKILLVGELAYNAERIMALERQGHQLYGLWVERPANFNAVGPLPFGHVQDIPINSWKAKVAEIKPDIIYGLLNYHAVPLAYKVLKEDLGIPFVWHFKEGPFFCRSYGTWEHLVYLYEKSDGQIYINEMTREWFSRYVSADPSKTFVMDGDLPSAVWFEDQRSALLSNTDGEIHTVVAGRPIGIYPTDIAQMASQRIHFHWYGDVFHKQFKEIIDVARSLAPEYVHLHANCTQENWVREFSQYDAGWLHCFKSQNNGEIDRASWHDLNSPARMSTYAAAGLPMLVKKNSDHRISSNEILEEYGMSIAFDSIATLADMFADAPYIASIRENAWKNRLKFSFDYYVDDLIAFFRNIIENKRLQ